MRCRRRLRHSSGRRTSRALPTSSAQQPRPNPTTISRGPRKVAALVRLLPEREQPTPAPRAQDEAREVADRSEHHERHLRVRERPARMRQTAADQDTRRDRDEREADTGYEPTVRPRPRDSCTEHRHVVRSWLLEVARSRKDLGALAAPRSTTRHTENSPGSVALRAASRSPRSGRAAARRFDRNSFPCREVRSPEAPRLARSRASVGCGPGPEPVYKASNQQHTPSADTQPTRATRNAIAPTPPAAPSRI